jgi:hypothetical protein
MKARLFTIKDNADKRSIMTACWDLVSKALLSGALDITVASASKTRAQEAKYHCMFTDIARQVYHKNPYDPNMRHKYGPAETKTGLVHMFEKEMAEAGTPLSKPGRTMLSFDGKDIIQIRPSTTGFLVKEAAEFIEFLFAYGATENVSWSDPETQAMYKDYFERTYDE